MRTARTHAAHPFAGFVRSRAERSVRDRREPKRPQDLVEHTCINLRLATHGALYVWEFQKGGKTVNVRVEGQLVFNTALPVLEAALAGFGPAYVQKDLARPYVAKGRLVSVLSDWCPPFPGYHLYYPSRRQPSAAFALVTEALRYRRSGRNAPA